MRRRTLACLLCALAPAVYGAHPLTTEDPDTQGQGGHQIEINTDWLRQGGAGKRVASFTYTYGALDKLDFAFTLPLSLQAPAGMNDTSLGVKWRMLEFDGFSFALKPELLLPTGDETKSLGNGRTSGALTAVVAYDTAQWRLLGNLGVTVNRYRLQTARDGNRSVLWRASASAWYAYRDNWNLVTDLGVERELYKSSNVFPAFALVGFIYSPNPQLDWDAGLRFGINCGQCNNMPRHQVGVGLTCRF